MANIYVYKESNGLSGDACTEGHMHCLFPGQVRIMFHLNGAWARLHCVHIML